VSIVFVDTTTLAPSVNQCCNEKGGVSTDTQAQRIATQLARIHTLLGAAAARTPTYLIVAGHYPIYSAGTIRCSCAPSPAPLQPLSSP
jgi:hypothetical protein